MELARTAGERLVDYQVSAEITRRLMALQRVQLTESQVIDRRARRALHDEILPGLHALLLDLTVQEANGAPSRVVKSLSEIHRQIADLLSDLPGNLPEGRTTDLARLGLAKALQRVVEVELRQAFDQVSWQVSPEAARAAQDLPPLQAEVLFYAAREAVRNAARHARSTSSGIPLRLEASLEWKDGLMIQIQDNGIGIDSPNRANSAQPGGQGLALHSTLLAVIGGSLSVQSEAGRYTCVSIKLPMKEGQKQP
jgi:signal transduction histidine kinase